AIGGGTARQLAVDELPRVPQLQLSEKRAARIRGDRGDPAGARREAEPVQRQGRLLRIEGHQRRPPRGRVTRRYRPPLRFISPPPSIATGAKSMRDRRASRRTDALLFFAVICSEFAGEANRQARRKIWRSHGRREQGQRRSCS